MEEGLFFFLEILVIKSTEPLGSKCMFILPCMLMGDGRIREKKLLPLQLKTVSTWLQTVFVGLHFLTVQILLTVSCE